MEIKIDKENKFTIVQLIGRLDSNTSLSLEKKLLELLEKNEDNLLIDCTHLNYISSSGLRVFLVAAKLLETKKQKLNFCCMKDFIKEVFDIAGFSTLFNIYTSRKEIINK